jgi:hypothetical protein
MSRRKEPPRRVSWADPKDLKVVVLGTLGWSGRVIEDRTGLTPGRVQYRLHRAGVKITDFRQMRKGTLGGAMARQVMRQQIENYADTIRERLPSLRRPGEPAETNGKIST